MNILAVDGATEYSGVLVVKNGQPVEWNVLRAVGIDVWGRIANFGHQLYELLYFHQIEILGYEYPSGNSSHSTNLKLGALMYETIRVFRLYSDYYKPDAQWVEIKPTQVKATGAHKNAMEFAGEQIGVTFDWSSKAEKKRLGNVADAVGIWLWLKENGYA